MTVRTGEGDGVLGPNAFTDLRYEDMQTGPLGRYRVGVDASDIAQWKAVIGDAGTDGVPMSFVLTWKLKVLREALGGIPAGGVLARHRLRFGAEPTAGHEVDTDVTVEDLYEKRGRSYVVLGFRSYQGGQFVAEDLMHLIWPNRSDERRPSPGVRPEPEPEPDGEVLVTGQISQAQIDRYAELSGDYNPLHVDPEAGRASPFGSTIAHGPIPLGYVFRALEAAHGRCWVPGLTIDARFVGPARPGDQVVVRSGVPGVFSAVDGEGRKLVVVSVGEG